MWCMKWGLLYALNCIVMAMVCILYQTQLFSKQFNTFSEFGNGCYSLVQCIIGHGVFGVKGDNDGGVKSVPSAPSPFKETQNIRK